MPSTNPHHFFQKNKTDGTVSSPTASCFSLAKKDTTKQATAPFPPSSQQPQKKQKTSNILLVQVGKPRYMAPMGYGGPCSIQ